MKKLLAMLLAVVMVLGLAACGSSNAPAATEAPAPAATNAPAAASTEAPAAKEELDPVTLKIWFHGTSAATPEASAKVLEAVNAYLADKINAKLEVIWGTWGDFDTSVVTALAGGDDVDMYFTCNWSADEYNKYARDGYWVKLDDMLPTYASDLLDIIPEGIWACAETDGYDGKGIYAIPALKDTATQYCWDVNGTLLAELGYDVDAVCAGKLDYFSSEFEEMLQKAKDAKGKDFYPLVIEPYVLERMVTLTSIVTGDIGSGAVLSYYHDAEQPSKDIGSTIINKFGSEEFMKFAKRTYEFSQKGFISPQAQNTATANDYRTSAQNNAEYLFSTQSYAYGCEIDFARARGIDVRMVPVTPPYMDATSGQGAMVAISAVSKNPERALMFLNLLNSDPELMTMLNYGLEGFTYNKNADGTISFIDENRSNYTPWRNGMGNIRMLPPTSEEGVTYWDDFAAYYDSAEALPMGGFVFDSTGLETEVAAIANVSNEYAFQVISGALDPEAVMPEFLQKLEDAGMNEFVAAAQEQLAAYLAG